LCKDIYMSNEKEVREELLKAVSKIKEALDVIDTIKWSRDTLDVSQRISGVSWELHKAKESGLGLLGYLLSKEKISGFKD
jgi:hypothetical protein